MIHEVPEPQPLRAVTVTTLDSAQSVAHMTMEDYAKIRHLLVGPVMVEWKHHYAKTGRLT